MEVESEICWTIARTPREKRIASLSTSGCPTEYDLNRAALTMTDRFKAASSFQGAGIVNFVSMYAQSDVRYYRTPWFRGTPWQKDAPTDLYWEQSPLKDVAKIKTPILILVGEKDVRVPSPRSVELYRALKANGVPTRPLHRAKGAARLEGATSSAVQDERGAGMVRRIRQRANLPMGRCSRSGCGGRKETGSPPPVWAQRPLTCLSMPKTERGTP